MRSVNCYALMTARLMVNASMDPVFATRTTLLRTARYLFIKYQQFPGQCQQKHSTINFVCFNFYLVFNINDFISLFFVFFWAENIFFSFRFPGGKNPFLSATFMKLVSSNPFLYRLVLLLSGIKEGLGIPSHSPSLTLKSAILLRPDLDSII